MKKLAGFILSALFMLKCVPFYGYAEEAREDIRLCAENKNLSLYVNYRNGEVILKDKRNGCEWRSSPENAEDDPIATDSVISELRSPLTITYCEPEKRLSTKMSSLYNADVKVNAAKEGVKIKYKFRKAGITVPLQLVLKDDCLEASVDISEVKESKESRKLSGLSIMSSFGCASLEDDGCFVIPDGSGAIINFNNGKTNAKSYKSTVYGRDITLSSLTKPDDAKQVYFPMYGIVNGSSGLMAVCTDGDTNAQLAASVSGVSKSSYNLCSFEFTLRSDDTYYMPGDNNTSFTVFESGDIKTDRISIRYYPVEDKGRKGMDYVDIAAAYRDYLMCEMNIERKESLVPELYIDLYGAAEKKKSFLGIPVTLKTSLTSSSEARLITETLKGAGAENIVISYNNWTDDGIKNRIDVKAKASGVIGSDDFYEFLKYAEENGAVVYPSVRNTSFRSGSGYSDRSDAAIRVSGEYAKLYNYDIVSGEADKKRRSLSLLTPSLYPEMFTELAESFSDKDIKNIGLSELAMVLYGDYGKSSVSRYKSKQLLIDGYETLQSSFESILAESANAYALPYADKISDLPLSSSRYDILDEDIPFYQIVLHGLRSYSTEPINKSENSRELLLRAVAAGSNPHYDMIFEKTSTLAGTELEGLYYAHYDSSTEQAAKDFLFAKTVLSDVSGQLITDYRQEKSKIYTEYENGEVIITDLEKGSVTVKGKEYFLSEFSVNGVCGIE